MLKNLKFKLLAAIRVYAWLFFFLQNTASDSAYKLIKLKLK